MQDEWKECLARLTRIAKAIEAVSEGLQQVARAIETMPTDDDNEDNNV